MRVKFESEVVEMKPNNYLLVNGVFLDAIASLNLGYESKYVCLHKAFSSITIVICNRIYQTIRPCLGCSITIM